MSQAKFLLSLPIGPLFLRHHIAWLTDKEAEDWLDAHGLKIILKRNVYVKPEVDLFAEQLGSDYHDMYVLCEKK